MVNKELDYVTGDPTKDAVLKRIEEPLPKLDDLPTCRVLVHGEGMVTSNGCYSQLYLPPIFHFSSKINEGTE